MNEIKSLVGRNPDIIAPFLRMLFSELDREQIEWAIMRGWETLPEWTRYDIDILVTKKSLRRAYKIIEICGKSSGWTVYSDKAYLLRRPVWLFRFDDMGFSSLRIDLMADTLYKWTPILDSAAMLKFRVKDKGIWHMPIWYAGASIVLKELMLHGKLEGELRLTQVQAAAKIKEFVDCLYSRLHEKELASHIVEAAHRKDDLLFKSLATRVRQTILRNRFSDLGGMLRYFSLGVLKRMFGGLNLFVAIIGPDGCGKTTIADSIESIFTGRPFAKPWRIKSDFGMPRLQSIKKIVCVTLGRKYNPPRAACPGERHIGMQNPHSRLRAICYVCYYGLGMIIGRLKVFFSRNYGRLIVADRYYYDYYYQNGFRNCPRWVIRLFEALSPCPDMIVALERPAEDIYAQKPELTVEEIRREQQVIREVFGARKEMVVIDAGKGLDDTIRKVEKAIAMKVMTLK